VKYEQHEIEKHIRLPLVSTIFGWSNSGQTLPEVFPAGHAHQTGAGFRRSPICTAGVFFKDAQVLCKWIKQKVG